MSTPGSWESGRPFELEPTDHPLAREQRDGISLERVHKINAPVLHASDSS